MKTDKKASNPVLDAVAGGLSGALARVVVGPLDVVKIRFQVQLEPVKAGVGSIVKSKYTGLTQALLTIFREEGIPVCVRLPLEHLCLGLRAVRGECISHGSHENCTSEGS